MDEALGVEIGKYSLYFLKNLGTFLFFLSKYFVVSLVEKLETLGNLSDIHKGVLNKFVHDELIFREALNLFGGTEIKYAF